MSNNDDDEDDDDQREREKQQIHTRKTHDEISAAILFQSPLPSGAVGVLRDGHANKKKTQKKRVFDVVVVVPQPTIESGVVFCANIGIEIGPPERR